MHDPLVATVIAIVGLLLVAVLSAVTLRWARLPYSVGLVVVGLLLGAGAEQWDWLEPLTRVELSPEIILFVFLPTLIFESAFNLDGRLLSKNLVPVLALAAPGLLISTHLIGGAIALLTPLTYGPALLFGALISATDPVAVVALFKELGAPRRLAILVEGESLFNDATAIVMFHIILAVAAGGTWSVQTLGNGVVDFLRVFAGGLLVGWLVGYLMVRFIAIADDDPLVEVALSTVVAYAAFVAAEHYLHVSGVMATVGAGVTVGAYGVPRFTPPVRAFLHQFWEFAAFVANGLIFLLVGLSVSLTGLLDFAGPIGWAILAALVARAVVVFGMVPLVGKFPGAESISRGYQAVMWWGGLRGAVALALAYSLPEGFPFRDAVIAMAVGVVLFTLLTGGLSMRRLIHAVGLDRPSLLERMATAQAHLAAQTEAVARLDRAATAGHFSPGVVGELSDTYRTAMHRAEADVARLQSECHREEVLQALRLEALAIEGVVYQDLQDTGFISEPVLRELRLELDLARDAVRRGDGRPDQREPAVPVELRLLGGVTAGLERLLPRSRWVQRHRLRLLSARYEHDLAIVEGSRRVRREVRQIGTILGAWEETVHRVEAEYEALRDQATHRLDDVAEHFPEYVAAVQLHTARRVALDAEADAVQSLARRGALPDTVSREARRAVDRERRELTRRPVRPVAPEPDELLERVPFFRALRPDDFSQVVRTLVSRTVLAGETVIRQGERGGSLFLIARGVVAVVKDRGGGAQERVATLHAGDFFGEMALLSDEPRTATVRATTSCQLYELSRKDVDALCEVCDGARDALVEAAHARRRDSLS